MELYNIQVMIEIEKYNGRHVIYCTPCQAYRWAKECDRTSFLLRPGPKYCNFKLMLSVSVEQFKGHSTMVNFSIFRFSIRQICSRESKRKQELRNVIGWRKSSLFEFINWNRSSAYVSSPSYTSSKEAL